MAALEETQFQIGSVVFGRDLPIEVRVFEVGAAEAELGDTDLPGQDGIVFGRDAKRGSGLTFELSVLTRDPDEARALFGQLAAEWDAAAARRTPRRVVPLRIRQPGSRTVVVYGRPRSLEVTSSPALRKVGRIDATATFQAADALFYEEYGEEGGGRQVTLTLIAAAVGGIAWPVTWPITWGAQGQRRDAVVNRGDAPTWPVITIHGPVANPEVEFLGTGRAFRLNTTLAYDRSITVDTRPWVRSVQRDDGASFAGVMRGSALSDMQLPVGQTVVAYRGTDLSGQSRCVISWRDAYTSP